MRGIIVDMFPAEFSRYVEVFGGAAWVLFYKPKYAPREIYNDFDSNLVNLFRVVRNQRDELIDSLQYVLDSREDFDLAIEQLKTPEKLTDVEWASCYFLALKLSYGARGKTYGANNIKMKKALSLIDECSDRLEGVSVEHRDFQKLIEQEDREKALFFCDPPYVDTEHYYDVEFSVDNHYRLRDTLDNIQGKFLLTYNDCKFIRDLYDGYYIHPVTRINNLAMRCEKHEPFHELIITNYDPEEESSSIKQLSLFED